MHRVKVGSSRTCWRPTPSPAPTTGRACDVANLISADGAGKPALLERVPGSLDGVRAARLEGDVPGSRDGDRLAGMRTSARTGEGEGVDDVREWLQRAAAREGAPA